jgi:hypothetical protein
MSDAAPRVFLSAGTKRSQEQEQFIAALQERLASAGFETRSAQWSSINPLAKIKEEMNGCDGAVIVAFERIYAKEGRERAASTKFVQLRDIRFTTVWNHVEAAMAYCLGLPLFIVCEPNLREEGLLEKFDWYIHRTRLSADTPREPEFLGIFQDWAVRVRKRYGLRASHAGPTTESPETITVGNLLRNMKLVQFIALLGALLGILAGAVVVGSKWPGLAEFLK